MATNISTFTLTEYRVRDVDNRHMGETVCKSLFFISLVRRETFDLDEKTNYEVFRTRISTDPPPSLPLVRYEHRATLAVYNVNVLYTSDNKCFRIHTRVISYARVRACVHRLWEPTKGNFAPFGDSEQGERAVRLSAHGRTIAIRRLRRSPYQAYYIVYCRRFYCRARVTRLTSHTHTRACVRVYVWRINGRGRTQYTTRAIRSRGPLFSLRPSVVL